MRDGGREGGRKRGREEGREGGSEERQIVPRKHNTGCLAWCLAAMTIYITTNVTGARGCNATLTQAAMHATV